jgi:hypothetical protein
MGLYCYKRIKTSSSIHVFLTQKTPVKNFYKVVEGII